MKKHGVLFGALGTLVMVFVFGLTFTWVSAQDIQVYIPFWNSPNQQQSIDAAGSTEAEAETKAVQQPIPPSDIVYGTPVAGEIRPVPIEFLPTPGPITQEMEEETQKAMEEAEPEHMEGIFTTGPETKGQRTLIIGVGWVALPADVWVDFSGMVSCHIEAIKSGKCISDWVTVFHRDGTTEELLTQDGKPVFLTGEYNPQVIETFSDVIEEMERVILEEASK